MVLNAPSQARGQSVSAPAELAEVSAAADRPRGAGKLTVIVPAYNEASTIADTLRSLQAQTTVPDEIIVVDDCSTDGTREIALSFGVTCLRPEKNTGSKAGAQNYALQHVETEFTMALDADTVLAPDAIEKLRAAMGDPEVAAACGFVVPKTVKTVWERGRYVEYLFAFTFFKAVQDYYEKPLISSGCFSMYRTAPLKANNGWSTRTLAEDMDLTWSYYRDKRKVRFVEDAVCYPSEPPTYHFLKKQLRRWSHGFVQNLSLHWRDVLQVPYLRWAIAMGLWDAVIASIAYIVVLPVLMIVLRTPWPAVGYVLDAPVVAIPVLVAAYRRKEMRRAVASLPAFFVMRYVNSLYMLGAMWSHFVLRRRLTTYEKGH